MSIARQQHTDNIVIGAGEFYLIEGGQERYLGDSTGGSITISAEYVTVESNDDPIAQRLVHTPRSVTRRMSLTLHDINEDNIRLFILGDVPETDSQSTAQVAREALEDVEVGRWYQLGVTKDRPEGVWAISAGGVEVHTANAAGTTVPAAKYEVDAATGRIRFTDLDGVNLIDRKAWITYAPVANMVRRVEGSGAAAREYGIRFIENNTIGSNKRIFAPRCTVAPDGAWQLKSRTEEQALPLQIEILDPDGTAAPLVVYGPEG